MALERKNIDIVRDEDWPFGTCLWEDDEGKLLGDDDGRFLSLDGYVGDIHIEIKMRKAAQYWMGEEFSGKPRWLFGARKVTDSEHDDQMERLLDGKIPDWEEDVRLGSKGEK